MTINNAMCSGVSGLKVNSDGMSVIANNIANSNTRGFKSDRAEFEDLLSVTLNENAQIGRGARLQAVKTLQKQGALTNTDVITDIAIHGDGYFVVRNNTNDSQDASGNFYTRVGAFHFDREGMLVDSNGSRVQGYTADKNGRVGSKVSDIEMRTNTIPPNPSSVVTIHSNLDPRMVTPPPFDVTKPLGTSNFSSTVNIYDEMGRAHTATVYFSKTSDTSKNAWDWRALVDGQELSADPKRGPDGEPIPSIVAQGTLDFDDKGKLSMKYRDAEGHPTHHDTQNQSDAFEVSFRNTSKPQKIQFNFGGLIGENGQVGNQTSTSIASKSETIFHSQNGYEAGQLKSLRIEMDGSVRGVYTNGMEQRLAVLALASFPNSDGLQKTGRNYFIATSKTGEPQIGKPLEGLRGSLYASSLEESNVDLAQQFVDMITTQRAFQANSKTINTTDTMLQEIIELKR